MRTNRANCDFPCDYIIHGASNANPILYSKEPVETLIGNIIGTNIFNIGFVLALPIAILGSVTTTSFNFFDMFIMLIAGSIIYLFSKDDKKIDKLEGISMISIFIIYYLYLFFL